MASIYKYQYDYHDFYNYRPFSDDIAMALVHFMFFYYNYFFLNLHDEEYRLTCKSVDPEKHRLHRAPSV